MGLSAWMTAAPDASQLQDGWVQINVGSTSTDGARMHYVKVGNGPPLLLLHGLLGSAYTWRYNLDGLSQSSTVYAMDMLGMGHSERVPGLDAGLSATADRIIAFMDDLHLDKADMLGTAHGGALAMLLAARYPHRVGKLVLAAPANPCATEMAALLNFYRNSLSKWLAPQVPSTEANLPHVLQELAVGWMYGNPANVSAATLENYMAALRIPYTPEHVLRVIDCWEQDMHLLSDAIVSLRNKPMLLIWGDRDRSVELASATALQKLLPLAKLTVLPGAGHVANEEMPEEFNLAVRQWLERRNPAAPLSGTGSPLTSGSNNNSTNKNDGRNSELNAQPEIKPAASSSFGHKHLTGPIFLRRYTRQNWA